MTSFQVALFLTICVFFISIISKKKCKGRKTYTVFIILLYLMVTAGFLFDVENIMFWGPVKLKNMVLFISLLFITSIPWLTFDRGFNVHGRLTISAKGESLFSTIFTIVIIMSFFSMIYVAPYAIRSFNLGAVNVRGQIQDIGVLPPTIFTTIAVGVGSLSPIFLLFFFISLFEDRFRRFRLPLFISAFTYIVVSMPFMARDGFVVLPIFFLIFYFLFTPFLDNKTKRAIKRYFIVLMAFAGTFLMIYTISRFYVGTSSGFDEEKFLGGSWGYLFQQPYVFDRTLEVQTHWHGLSLRFPILSFLSKDGYRVVERYQDFETMFGTMLSEFYSIGGYVPLFVFTISFTLIYHFGLKILLNRGNIFAILWFFSVYLMLEITGLFYMRYGGESNNWLFLIITILPFALKSNYIIYEKQ